MVKSGGHAVSGGQVADRWAGGEQSVAGYILADVNGGDEAERLRTAMAYGSAAASLPGTTLPTPADLPEQAAVVTRLS